MDALVDNRQAGTDFSQQIANFGQLVGNILSTVKPELGEESKLGVAGEMSADLHEAIENDNLEKVRELSSKVDLNEKFDATVNAQHAGITPLALACALNKIEMTKTLLECGADVNVPFAALNTTALMTSSYHGHMEVVKLLLVHGAQVHAVDLQQSTALGYAFGGTRNLDVIDLLLAAQINVNQKNMLGMSAFLLAAGYGNEKLVHMILQAGADPKATNDFGNNAIHIAVVGKQELLKKMRKLGSAEAAAADRSLNRRNLDVAIQEWARLHKDSVGGNRDDQESLAKVGRIMMSIGHQLDDESSDDGDEQERIQKRVQAVWKYRQDKLKTAKDRRKSAIWSLLTCAGGRSKRAEENMGNAKPYVPVEPPPSTDAKSNENKSEVSQLSERFARILRMLIDAGCEVDQIDKTFGLTPLDITMLNGDMESSAVLASAGADPNHLMKMLALKELYQAIVMNQRKDVKQLLQYDEDLDVNLPFSRFNVDSQSSDEGLTPLTLAARQGDPEICKFLIKKGARVNDVGPSGRFPLCEASAKGYKRVVDVLLASNADIEITSPAMASATPLAASVINQQYAVTEILVRRGAKVDRRLADGKTPLMRAFEEKDMNMASLILESDLEQNFLHKDGLTAEMAASYQSKERDVEAILQRVSEANKEFDERSSAPGSQAGSPPKLEQPPQQIIEQQRAAPIPTLAQQAAVENLIITEEQPEAPVSQHETRMIMINTPNGEPVSVGNVLVSKDASTEIIVTQIESTTVASSPPVLILDKVESSPEGPPPIPTTDLPVDEEEEEENINEDDVDVEEVIVQTVSSGAAPVVKMAEIEDIDEEDADDSMNESAREKHANDELNNNPDDNTDVLNTTGGSDFNENTMKTEDDNTTTGTNLKGSNSQIDNINITPHKSTETTI